MSGAGVGAISFSSAPESNLLKANLICAEGRLLLAITLAKTPEFICDKRIVFGHQHGILKVLLEQGVGTES